MATQIRVTDAKAQLTLPLAFANSVVVLEIRSDEEIILRKATVAGRDGAVLRSLLPNPTDDEEDRGSDVAPCEVPVAVAGTAPVAVTRTSGGRLKVDGHALTSFLKGLGFHGWTVSDARLLLRRLAEVTEVDELAAVADKSTVGCQVGDGAKMRRGEEPNHPGERAPLNATTLAALRQLVSDE